MNNKLLTFIAINVQIVCFSLIKEIYPLKCKRGSNTNYRSQWPQS